ncbi:hypothetical protein SCP_0507510 [Sparassis crispa]|uniref:ribonuclease H n=1 Tax=Sparassis crispa TaxID=139825 RepID=A0A401GNA1_9APHY|nr:hypothetical protein SCP_0507510 [Sparassis crispa]GBE83695.1 hypothetical protein SCP_0507510 [Sparassis crispa]
MTDQQILFNPSITTTGHLKEGFRIFSNHLSSSLTVSHRSGRPVLEESTTVYTDSSCINNRDQNTQAGAGIWFTHNDPRNTSLRLPSPHNTNQAGEVAAILQASQIVPPFTPLHILSNSKYTINGLTIHLPH